MNRYLYKQAFKEDASDIKRIYDLNIDKLHGVVRTLEEWESLIDNRYFVVRFENTICGWFRLDFEGDKIFLGMIQVDPSFQRQGVGSYILHIFEMVVGNNFLRYAYVHTTEDNKEAIAFYLKNGYEIISHEECQTADGVTRNGITLMKRV